MGPFWVSIQSIQNSPPPISPRVAREFRDSLFGTVVLARGLEHPDGGLSLMLSGPSQLILAARSAVCIFRRDQVSLWCEVVKSTCSLSSFLYLLRHFGPWAVPQQVPGLSVLLGSPKVKGGHCSVPILLPKWCANSGTLDILLNPSVPQFSHLLNKENRPLWWLCDV